MPRIAVVDVQYERTEGTGALLLLEDWTASTTCGAVTTHRKGLAEYEPGAFFKRELPVLLALLQELEAVASRPEIIVVDGYCWLGPERAGLGVHLYSALVPRIPVVGVAKSSFVGAAPVEVRRGSSQRPLFVTAVGMDLSVAAACVQSMHGPHRLPTFIKGADVLCRQRQRMEHAT